MLKNNLEITKQQLLKSVGTNDDLSYNIWDGLPDNSHLIFNNNKDHLNRTMMDTTECKLWINQLWNHQISMFIKEGSRYEWEYKKCNNKFFKRRGVKKGNSSDRILNTIRNDRNKDFVGLRANQKILQYRQEYNILRCLV